MRRAAPFALCLALLLAACGAPAATERPSAAAVEAHWDVLEAPEANIANRKYEGYTGELIVSDGYGPLVPLHRRRERGRLRRENLLFWPRHARGPDRHRPGLHLGQPPLLVRRGRGAQLQPRRPRTALRRRARDPRRPKTPTSTPAPGTTTTAMGSPPWTGAGTPARFSPISSPPARSARSG